MEHPNSISFSPAVDIKIEKSTSNAMDTNDFFGDDIFLMEKFLEDFGLEGIGEENNDDHRDNGNGPSKRGKTNKKRRKQGISPNDPRKFYTDRIVNALCSGDIENVRAVMERYHEPDCLYIQRFTNNTPDMPGYREIHGRNQMLAFYRSILASSPDCVVKVTDRQLNVYQDGTSYLVSKINFSGAWLFRIFFSNVVRKTRSFISTFFNKPTILNPFPTKSAQTLEFHDETTSGDESIATESKSPAFSFSNFLSRGKVDTDHYKMHKSNRSSSSIRKTTVSQTSNESLSQEKGTLPVSIEHSTEESKYLHYDMHLIEGKASVYDKSVRPPTPMSPLSVSSLNTATSDKIDSASLSNSVNNKTISLADTNGISVSEQKQATQSKKTFSFTTLFKSKNKKNANINGDNSRDIHRSKTISSSATAFCDSDDTRNGDISNTNMQPPEESPDVLEAEAPWQDLPFTIAKDEVTTNTPIPSPAVLIVTPESEVSVIPAHPKPYRVNIAISNVAHINANGRIYKSEMFMKAEVSISWWPSAKAKAAVASEEDMFKDLKDFDDEEFDDENESDIQEEKLRSKTKYNSV